MEQRAFLSRFPGSCSVQFPDEGIVLNKSHTVKWCHLMSSNVASNESGQQEWFTPTEAATYLRVSRQTIYKYMDQGLLPYYELKSGGGRRLRRADLDALLEPPSTGQLTSPD